MSLMLILFPLLAHQVQAQVLYQTLEAVYAEDFDDLPSTGGSFIWEDSSTLAGWYASSTVAAGFNPAGVSTGSSTAGNLYSFGASGSADRSLGSLSSSAVGGLYYGTRIINQTGATITAFSIGYTGEQWRKSGAAAQAMSFSYGLKATSLRQGTFVDVPALTFVSPVTGGSAGSLNGNLAANRTILPPSTLTGVEWHHGEELWMRWYDPDHAGTDHALSVDDFSFSAFASDSDNDLIPNEVEIDCYINQNNPSDGAGDRDADGFTNQEEYWMGSGIFGVRSAESPVVIHVNKGSTSTQQLGTAESPFKTIQAAIDAADPEVIQAILVEPGVYAERLYLNGKANVHIFSNLGAQATVIDGGYVDSSVVRIYNVSKSTLSGFTIRNAQTSWSGAGVRVEAGGGAVWISNNIICNNSSSNMDSSGGGGGLYVDAADDSMLFNNIIYGNTARRGGGVLFKNGKVRFYHNTVVGNAANAAGLGGGLSCIQGVVPEVKNTILWANTGTTGYENLHQTGVSFSIVQYGAPGQGNLSLDPLLVDPAQGDYHIQQTSPAIGVGYPLSVITDIDSHLRASSVLSPRDIGADQYFQGQIDGDSDGDGMPDSWETLYDLNPAFNDANADADGDGLTNLQEYLNGTNPRENLADLDGDGWLDSTEQTVGGDVSQRDNSKLLLQVTEQ
jgi:hypothetical protein